MGENYYVDGDLTFAGANAGAGDGGLAASGSQRVVESVAFDHYSISHNYLTFRILLLKVTERYLAPRLTNSGFCA